MNFTQIDIIREFTHSEITYGVYSVIFENEQEIFIRNGNSIGAVCFLLDEPASKCVSEVRNDVKKEFLETLGEMRKNEFRTKIN